MLRCPSIRPRRILSLLLLFMTPLVALQDQSPRAQEQGSTPTSSKLTNKDILDMQAAGLSSEVIAEKIRTSVCEFDSTPPALIQMKAAGVPDAIILAITRSQAPPAPPAASPQVPQSPKTPEAATAAGGQPKGYAFAYVKSDRKWKYGLRSEPYDKISEYFEKRLTEALEQKGIHRIPVLDSGCCQVTVELLEVTSHPAAIKKPGVDVSANVSVTDGSKRPMYGRGYRGESRTMMNTWGHLINHAVENMVDNIVSDGNLLNILATGSF